MREKIAKLIDVKSIITFTLTGVFAYLSLTEKISEDQFMLIFTMCISFFFGRKTGKDEARSEGSKVE
jgi:hypothetical protein